MRLLEALDIILEQDEERASSVLAQGNLLIKKLNHVKRAMIDIKHSISIVKTQINAELAMRLRRSMPSLNVGLSHGMCKVGYRSKHLLFTPDLEKGIWIVKSTDPQFEQRFRKLYINELFIDNGIAAIITAIKDYFTNHYKTLGEEISGNGLLMIEEKVSNLADLVQYQKEIANKACSLKI